MQLKEPQYILKQNLKQKTFQDIYYVQLLENSYHKCPSYVSGKKAALMYWKTLNISTSPSVRLVENIVIVRSMHILHKINAIIFFKYFFEPCTVIYLCSKNQQNAHFLQQRFNLIVVSSTYFEHPSVHPQEDLYMQFYGIPFMLKL